MEAPVSRTKSDMTSTLLSVLKNINTRSSRRVTWGSQSIIYFEQSPVHLVQSQIPVATKGEKRTQEQVIDLREVFGDDFSEEQSTIRRRRKKSCLDKELALMIGDQKDEDICEVRNDQLKKKEKIEPEECDPDASTMGRESLGGNSTLPFYEDSPNDPNMNFETSEHLHILDSMKFTTTSNPNDRNETGQEEHIMGTRSDLNLSSRDLPSKQAQIGSTDPAKLSCSTPGFTRSLPQDHPSGQLETSLRVESTHRSRADLAREGLSLVDHEIVACVSRSMAREEEGHAGAANINL
jgi:hypothetical protein